MQRELYLFKSENRLNMFLSELSRNNEFPDSVLGLGFFAAQPQGVSGIGVDLCVSPLFLKETLLRAISREALLPFSSDPIFLGAVEFSEGHSRMRQMLRRRSEGTDVRSIRHWVLSGVHTFFATPTVEGRHANTTWCMREISETQGISDAVATIMREMFRRVLNLRASTVVLAADTELLEAFFSALARWRLEQGNFVRLRDFLRLRLNERIELILREILVWLVEESFNDRVAVLCRKTIEHEHLLLASRYILRNTANSQPIQFRL